MAFYSLGDAAYTIYLTIREASGKWKQAATTESTCSLVFDMLYGDGCYCCTCMPCRAMLLIITNHQGMAHMHRLKTAIIVVKILLVAKSWQSTCKAHVRCTKHEMKVHNNIIIHIYGRIYIAIVCPCVCVCVRGRGGGAATMSHI